jgi:hypothetical protein
MKIILGLFCFLAAASILAPASHATDFVFSSFQCDPSSCSEQTLPTEVGSSLVSFNATCTGGVVGDIEGSALAQVGIPEACSTPYVAKAQVQQSTTTQLDDFGCPFNLSSVTQIAQILTPFLVPVFTDKAGLDCQGGTFGPTNNGDKPC